MASLLSGRRTSLLDQPIGIDAQRKRDLEDRRIRNEVQTNQKLARAGRLAYRMSMRQNNPAQALAAISWMRNNGVISNFSASGPGRNQLQEAYQTSMEQQKAKNQNAGIPQIGQQVPFVAALPGSELLDKRKSFFSDIQESLLGGGDPLGDKAFRAKAKELGINNSIYEAGVRKANVSNFFKKP